MIQPDPEPNAISREPSLQPAARSVSTIPDTADVLALKAAIDSLARQVAALERRLASDSGRQPASHPSPPVKAVERPPALSEAPPVGSDRRL